MKINPKAYAEDCDCGTPAGIPCPHTPIRCKHEFKYACEEGNTRQCSLCGFLQVAVMTWEVIASSFEDYD